jgi:spore coat protein U-like protein
VNRYCALLLLLAAQNAPAATLCRLVSGGGLAFGTYNTLNTAHLESVANILVTCERSGGPATETVTMALGAGSNGTSVNARRMAQTGGAGDYLSYGLFRDIGRSNNWGNSVGIDTVSQAVTVPNHGSASVTFTIYGRIPAQQDVTAGDYADSVQVTVTP